MKEPTERIIIKTHPDSGCVLIYEERMRQIHSEGWTPEHDGHNEGELAKAAACYAVGKASIVDGAEIMTDLRRHHQISKGFTFATLWPWDRAWWKPSPENRIKELVKAGALIAAEIDRLKRLEGKRAAK